MDTIVVFAKIAVVVFVYAMFVALAIRMILWISGVGDACYKRETKKLFVDIINEVKSVDNADIDRWVVITRARLEGADCRVASNYLRDVVKNTPREHVLEAVRAFFEGAVAGGRTY